MSERAVSDDLDSDPLFGRPLFATLSADTARALRAEMPEQEFDKGDVIFSELLPDAASPVTDENGVLEALQASESQAAQELQAIIEEQLRVGGKP